jgi:hypothetical protein
MNKYFFLFLLFTLGAYGQEANLNHLKCYHYDSDKTSLVISFHQDDKDWVQVTANEFHESIYWPEGRYFRLFQVEAFIKENQNFLELRDLDGVMTMKVSSSVQTATHAELMINNNMKFKLKCEQKN